MAARTRRIHHPTPDRRLGPPAARRHRTPRIRRQPAHQNHRPHPRQNGARLPRPHRPLHLRRRHPLRRRRSHHRPQPPRHVELPRDEGDIENDLPHLSYPDIETLADTAHELTGRPDDELLLELLAYSGPRIGEATALKVRDLDPDNDRARIHRTWTVDREGRRKLGPVKTWEKRWLPVMPFLMRELTQLTAGRGPDDFVFTAPRGGPIDGGNWYTRVWTKTRTNAGLAHTMSVHDLRHVAATNAIAAGADVKLVQQMLGHKDATETLNTYAHLWPDRVAEVIAAVEQRRAEALAAAHTIAA